MVALVEGQTKLHAIEEAEQEWQEKIVALFGHGKEPPILVLGETSLKPSEVQENFRVKMLNYWASNPTSLRYCAPIEPLNSGMSIFEISQFV